VIHSIISWDCSFRNFFHLVKSINGQNFNKNSFEFLYIEQRNQKIADEYNHSIGLESLKDIERKYGQEMNFKVYYMSDAENRPYHLGRINNFGLAHAKGEIISVMDGDTIVPTDFLKSLEEQHEKDTSAVINLYRHMCEYPIGVSSYSDWKTADVDIDKCLRACKTQYVRVPTFCGNKGPMISARRGFWEAVGGYDESDFWCTSVSKLGIDVNRRLEMVTGTKSKSMQNSFCVHPWHPIGYSLSKRTNRDELVKQYFKLQDEAIKWSETHNTYSVKDRSNFSEDIAAKNRSLIDSIISEEMDYASVPKIPDDSITKVKFKTGLKKLKYFLNV